MKKGRGRNAPHRTRDPETAQKEKKGTVSRVSLYIFSCNVLPESIKVELSLAKELRISEENVKKFIKKIPEKIFRKTGHLESRGGNLTFDAEELIKNNLNEEDKSNFDENPYLKFHSGSDLA